ncbi:MAG: hypothetical protein ABIU84_08540 [Thermoanaerobaculia bacterium]
MFWALVLAFTSVNGASAAQMPGNAPQSACLADGQVEDILQVEGVVYLAGRFTHVRPPGEVIGGPLELIRSWFAACDADTGAVLAWDPLATCDAGPFPTCANNPRGQTLALSADGQSIYLGGKFRAIGGVQRRHAARVARTNAALDASWLPEPNDRVQRLLVAPDGARVYIAGNFTAVGGCGTTPCHAYLAAVSPTTGLVVSAFDPVIASDAAAFASVYSIALSQDSQTLYFGGEFDSVDTARRSGAAAIDAATGATPNGFAPALADTNPNDSEVQVYDIQVDRDWIYLCGDWWVTEGIGTMQNQRNVNRFAPATGAVDTDFWIATDGGVQACVLDPDLGVLFVGGHFDCVRAWTNSTTPVDPNPAQCGTDALFVGTQQRDLFAMTIADGTLLPWNPDTAGAAGTWALSRANGRLFAGGELAWPRTGTATHQSLLRFPLPLFADGFEQENADRWSATFPPS